VESCKGANSKVGKAGHRIVYMDSHRRQTGKGRKKRTDQWRRKAERPGRSPRSALRSTGGSDFVPFHSHSYEQTAISVVISRLETVRSAPSERAQFGCRLAAAGVAFGRLLAGGGSRWRVTANSLQK